MKCTFLTILNKNFDLLNFIFLAKLSCTHTINVILFQLFRVCRQEVRMQDEIDHHLFLSED